MDEQIKQEEPGSGLEGLEDAVEESPVDVEAKVQFGMYNWGEDIKGSQSGIVNFADVMKGLQAGGANVADDMVGLQTGTVNYAPKMKGIQAGLFNVAEDGSYIQTGLICVRPGAPLWKRYLPFVRIHF
tara:strand:+ start:2690 stop:3073 length:384 start_codon:yes stop_codon:yes gene_type:complete